MKRTVQTVNRCIFALGVVGSLTFGAAQAFGVSLPSSSAQRPWCDPVKCNEQCGGYGICQNNVCLCY
jgi:hypothetical protein